MTGQGGAMHILVGLIVIVAALIFAPWLVAIAVGLMATYWVFGVVIVIATIACLVAWSAVKSAKGVGFLPGGYTIEAPPAGVQVGEPHYEIIEQKEAKPAPAISMSPCGSCGESIKRHSMFCPCCGRDPRTKQ